MALLQEVAYHPFVPKDWYDLAKATLWWGDPNMLNGQPSLRRPVTKGRVQ